MVAFLIAFCNKKALTEVKAFVLEMGLEPIRPNGHKILSLACLPIPPLEHQLYLPIAIGKNIGIFYQLATVKQSLLNGAKVSGRRGSNPRPPPWQGGALSAELLSLIFHKEHPF